MAETVASTTGAPLDPNDFFRKFGESLTEKTKLDGLLVAEQAKRAAIIKSLGAVISSPDTAIDHRLQAAAILRLGINIASPEPLERELERLRRLNAQVEGGRDKPVMWLRSQQGPADPNSFVFPNRPRTLHYIGLGNLAASASVEVDADGGLYAPLASGYEIGISSTWSQCGDDLSFDGEQPLFTRLPQEMSEAAVDNMPLDTLPLGWGLPFLVGDEAIEKQLRYVEWGAKHDIDSIRHEVASAVA